MKDVPFDVVQIGDDPQAIFRQLDRPASRSTLRQVGLALTALNLTWRATGQCPQPNVSPDADRPSPPHP